MTEDLKTFEQMAEEYAEDLYKDSDYPKEILVYTKKATAAVFLAGYKAAKETYKDAISAYEDVAKQMLEEAVRLMSPKDQLADADKVMDTCEHILDMEKMVDVNSPEKPDGWISVKERLPEKTELVLIYQPKAGNGASSHDEHGWGMWENGLTCEPTHWMPLPEPPKDGKK